MRKIFILLIILGCLAGISSGVIGYIFKRKIENDSLKVMTTFLNMPLISVEVANYHEGWFYSTMQLKMSLRRSDLINRYLPFVIQSMTPSPEVVMVLNNVTIQHGPLLLFKDIKHNSRFMLGWVHIAATISSSNLLSAVMAPNSLIVADMVMDFSHNSHFLFLLPRGSLTDSQDTLTWSAGEFDEVISADYKIINTLIHMQSVELNWSPLQVQVNIPNFIFHIQFNKENNLNLWVGGMLLNLSAAHINLNKIPIVADLTGMQAIFLSSLTKDKLSSAVNLHIQDIKLSPLQHSLRLVLNVNLDGLDAKATKSLNKNVENKLTAIFSENSSSITSNIIALLKTITVQPEFKNVFKVGFLSGAQLWLSSAEGMLQAQAAMSLPPLTLAMSVMSSKALHATLTVQAPQHFLDYLFMPSTTQQNTLANMLNAWQKSGLLVPNNKNNYCLSVVYQNQQLQVNAVPLADPNSLIAKILQGI